MGEGWTAIGHLHATPDNDQVYIYRLIDVLWVHHQTLVSPGGEEGFGSPSMAFGGNRLVIGASQSDAPAPEQGQVYIYELGLNSQWSLTDELVASDGLEFEGFGYSVDISGDRIVAAARDADVGENIQQGAAYVFEYDGDGWQQTAKLIDPDGEEMDLFGVSVAIEGDTIVVGAHGNEDAGSGSGAAFVFEHDGENWQLVQQLAPDSLPSGTTSAWFGRSVDIQAGRVAVGASHEMSQNGAAYVFDRVDAQYERVGRLTAGRPGGPFPLLGERVEWTFGGTVLLAGAPFDDEFAYRAGAVHIFREENDTWVEQAKLFPPTPSSSQFFGYGFSVSGSTAIVRASGSGTHYMIGLDATDCNSNGQADACDIHNGTSFDHNDNGIPDECEATGDLNGDGVVNVLDLLLLITHWGACAPQPPGCTADLNFDGTVNVLDLLVMLSNWG